jgi:ribosomal protein L11 methyltransferase
MSATGSRWLEMTVRCPSAGDRSALLADGLLSLGARAVEERGGWYVSYFAEPEDVDAFVSEARAVLAVETGFERIEVEHGWQADEEWAQSWKRGLAPRRVTDRIVVHPSWFEPKDVRADDIVIVLDPGMAFGTAEHETTRGCLRLIDGVVRGGDRLLDVGAGSGILAIAAARLGADEVVAIEGDPLACEAMAENVERNGVADRVQVVETWATSESIVAHGPASGIVANIESGLLVPLFEGFSEALDADGWLIVSGILDHEWEEVEGSLSRCGFRRREVDADGEWRSGLFDRGPVQEHTLLAAHPTCAELP